MGARNTIKTKTKAEPEPVNPEPAQKLVKKNPNRVFSQDLPHAIKKGVGHIPDRTTKIDPTPEPVVARKLTNNETALSMGNCNKPGYTEEVKAKTPAFVSCGNRDFVRKAQLREN